MTRFKITKKGFKEKKFREVSVGKWFAESPDLLKVIRKHKPKSSGRRKFAYFFYEDINENEIVIGKLNGAFAEEDEQGKLKLIVPSQPELDDLIIEKALSLRTNAAKERFFEFQSDVYHNDSKEILSERVDAWNSLLDLYEEQNPQKHISVSSCKKALSEISKLLLKQENDVLPLYDRVKALQFILSIPEIGNRLSDSATTEISSLIHFILGRKEPERDKRNQNYIYQVLSGSRDGDFKKEIRIRKLENLKELFKGFKTVSTIIDDHIKREKRV